MISSSAKQANKLLGRTGPFWMQDYFDRYIRDEEHFAAAREYIEQNPVKADLVQSAGDWQWGSASGKDAGGTPASQDAPLPGSQPAFDPGSAGLGFPSSLFRDPIIVRKVTIRFPTGGKIHAVRNQNHE